jgi:hypothetical protein
MERVRQKLIELIRQIIADHQPRGGGDDAEASCSCGAQGHSDYPGHVAGQIVDSLGLKPADIDEVKKRVRYVSAWLDWELTLLEGAEY